MDVKEFIIDYIQREYTVKTDDVLSLDFIKTGYIDSIGLISFYTLIEDEFDIEFSEEEIVSPKYHVVSELISLVENKLGKK